jgi:hypothetical protein
MVRLIQSRLETKRGPKRLKEVPLKTIFKITYVCLYRVPLAFSRLRFNEMFPDFALKDWSIFLFTGPFLIGPCSSALKALALKWHWNNHKAYNDQEEEEELIGLNNKVEMG